MKHLYIVIWYWQKIKLSPLVIFSHFFVFHTYEIIPPIFGCFELSSSDVIVVQKPNTWEPVWRFSGWSLFLNGPYLTNDLFILKLFIINSLVGPTRYNMVLDPLAVIHLDNQLYMSPPATFPIVPFHRTLRTIGT